jgi:hypothetical protein
MTILFSVGYEKRSSKILYDFPHESASDWMHVLEPRKAKKYKNYVSLNRKAKLMFPEK